MDKYRVKERVEIMLTIIDIIRSLSLLIGEHFPDYPVNDRDMVEEFPRPSYFIDVGDITTELATNGFTSEKADIEIYFYCADIYQGFLQLLDMKNELFQLLSKPLKITSEDGEMVAHVVLNNLKITISKADKALRVDCESELIQAIPELDYPYNEYMETLEVKGD